MNEEFNTGDENLNDLLRRAAKRWNGMTAEQQREEQHRSMESFVRSMQPEWFGLTQEEVMQRITEIENDLAEAARRGLISGAYVNVLNEELRELKEAPVISRRDDE